MANKMKFTSVGLAAAATARTNGPLIDIVKYAVGSGYNYDPDQSDTSLHGTQLYPVGGGLATPTNYYVTTDSNGNKVANFSLIMDDTIGDFQYGEIGLYLPGGELIALHAMSYLQPKIQSTPSSAGNTIEMLFRMILTGGDPIIEFTTITAQTATRAEYASFDLMNPPGASDANTYSITGKDEYGRAPELARADNDTWFSPQYDMKVGSFTTSASTLNSPYSLSSSSVMPNYDINVVPGRYLVRFTSGALLGRVRAVTVTPAWLATTVYVDNVIVRPTTPNGRCYRVTAPGTTGGTEPTWPTTLGGTVTSGSVTFTDYGPDNTQALSWAGSLGVAVPTGTTFDLYRASAWTDLERYLNEIQMRRLVPWHFHMHN